MANSETLLKFMRLKRFIFAATQEASDIMPAPFLLWSFLITVPAICAMLPTQEEILSLSLRSRRQKGENSEAVEVVTTPAEWKVGETAVIVCDMWDKHWCAGASKRVDELAPRMNLVLRELRNRGALIIHAPSDTIEFYADTPQRHFAQSAPAVPAPADIQAWQYLDTEREPPLPIDDSDNGCDDLPACPPYKAWTRQHPGLEIAPQDAISDNGAEVYNLLHQVNIKNAIVMGVHTNMCVLGRSFAIRRLVKSGLNVALMRDMTDALYNPRRHPYVSHERGTKLVIEHIERYWCPSISSEEIE